LKGEKMLIKNLVGERLLRETARLYCDIWKEPPWCEDFWKIEDVMQDIENQSRKKNAILLVALDDQENVIGFTWGYQINSDELSKISGHNYEFWDNITGKDGIFYVDEFGVRSDWRGNGVGQNLAVELINKIPRSEIKVATLRTDVGAKPARTVYEKIGFRELPIRDKKHQDRSYWLMKFA
jgi:ribosomal protein S18 acetylase RimI-like enzyme